MQSGAGGAHSKADPVEVEQEQTADGCRSLLAPEPLLPLPPLPPLPPLVQCVTLRTGAALGR